MFDKIGRKYFFKQKMFFLSGLATTGLYQNFHGTAPYVYINLILVGVQIFTHTGNP